MSDTLLVGVDSSECCNRALEFAAREALAKNAKLAVAYVIEWSPYSFNTPSENEQRHKRREEEIHRAETDIIAPVVERLQAQGVDAEGLVRHGHAASVLNELGDELDACVIYVGRTGTSRLKSLLFGSVSAALVQISDRPVTVVP